jgi:hypothetical protein
MCKRKENLSFYAKDKLRNECNDRLSKDYTMLYVWSNRFDQTEVVWY